MCGVAACAMHPSTMRMKGQPVPSALLYQKGMKGERHRVHLVLCLQLVWGGAWKHHCGAGPLQPQQGPVSDALHSLSESSNASLK